MSNVLAVAGAVMMAISIVIAWANAGGFVSRLTSTKTIEGQQQLIETNEKQIVSLKSEVASLRALVQTMTDQVTALHGEVINLKSYIADQAVAAGAHTP